MDKRQEIYDEISRTLTEYEETSGAIMRHERPYDERFYEDSAEEMYHLLVKIQRSWEGVITAQ